jgi:hypothetical protein
MSADSCACGHDDWRAPETQQEALALAAHQNAIRALLEEVKRDAARWLAVLRCRECGRYWAQDAISSGHADLLFVYPIETDEPERWLAAAQPLNPY